MSPISPFGWKNRKEGGTLQLNGTELEAWNSFLGEFAEAEAAAAQAAAIAVSDPAGSAVTAKTEAIAAAGATASTLVSGEATRAKGAEGERLAKSENLKDLPSASTARTNLGLGTAATQASSAFDAAGAASTAQSNAEVAAAGDVAGEKKRAEEAETSKLSKAANLSDVANPGESRQNLHVPELLPVQAVATANVASLSGLPTVDGFTLEAEQQVLLTAQAEAKNNGPWVVGAGAWTRPTDFPTGTAVKARKVAVVNGTVNAHTEWLLKTNTTVTVGTTAQVWELLQSASVVSSSAMVDVCRQFGAKPGQDITTALEEAIAALVTLGGGTLYFSKPGHYPLEGAVKEGEAFSKKYAGQLLIPPRTTEEGPLVIRLMGPSPASKPMLGQFGEKVANLPGVVITSNATSGYAFAGIPGFEAIAGTPFSDVLFVFENATLLCPGNPQCGGIDATYMSRFRMRNATIGVVGTEGQIAPPNELPTGTKQGVLMPQLSNAGSIRFENVAVYGFPSGVGLTEHGQFDQVFIGYCKTAFTGLGGAHANSFGYVSVEECPTILTATTGGGGVVYGLIDYENPVTNAFKPGNVIEDPLNLLKGSLTLYSQTNGLAGNPMVGGRGMDLINLAQGATSWRTVYPYDNFQRTASIAGNIGNCSVTSHPWKVVEGAGTVTAGSTKAEPGKLSNAEAKAFRALVPYLARVGTGSRSIRTILKTAASASAYDVRIQVGHLPSPGHELRVKLSGGDLTLELVGAATTTLATAASVVAASTTYEVTVAVSHPKFIGAPEQVQVFLGETEVLSFTLTAEQKAELPPMRTNAERTMIQLEDGVGFGGGDTTSVFELFHVTPLGSQERGATGSTGGIGPTGPAGPGAVPILIPVHAGGSPIATSAAAIGTAFKACFQRAIVPNTGKVRDISIWNGATVNGNTRAAIFDTGDAVAGKYTLLWEGAEVAMAGTNAFQSLGAPELSVTAGQQILIVAMNSGTTATFGIGRGLLNSAAGELPASYLPATGGAAPKIVGFREFTELKYATITEAQLIKGGSSLLLIGRIS